MVVKAQKAPRAQGDFRMNSTLLMPPNVYKYEGPFLGRQSPGKAGGYR